MAAPSAVFSHGEDTGQSAERWVERARGRDSFELTCYAPTRTHAAYAVGQPAPDYPHMRIVEAQREQDIGSWLHRLQCEGIASQTQDFKELSRSDRSPEEGWDEVSLTIYTRVPDDARWRKGARLQRTNEDVTPPAGYENMYITDVGKIWSDADGYYELPLTLLGLRGTKPYKRRINGAVVTSVTRSDGTTAILADRYENFPPTDSGTNDSLGASDGEEIEYDAASLSVSDTHVTAEAPPTELVGQPWTPPDAPDVVVLTLYGESVKKFWPFGWVCTSMPCEKLAVTGAELWVVTVNYIFRLSTIPVTL